jgi:hypothetical protein
MIEPPARSTRAGERRHWRFRDPNDDTNADPSDDPPEEPPSQVSSELLWRVAVRLYRDHSRDRQVSTEGEPRCARCPHPWPCSGRRLAELALTVATT